MKGNVECELKIMSSSSTNNIKVHMLCNRKGCVSNQNMSNKTIPFLFDTTSITILADSLPSSCYHSRRF